MIPFLNLAGGRVHSRNKGLAKEEPISEPTLIVGNDQELAPAASGVYVHMGNGFSSDRDSKGTVK